MRRVLLAVAATTSSVLCIDLIRAAAFFCAGAACNFISTSFQQSHLRLRHRRILIGNLYRATHSSPPPHRSGQRALSRKRIWKWAKAMVLTRVSLSFCFCSAFHQGIGNAYFITLRCFVGGGVCPSCIIWNLVSRSNNDFQWNSLDLYVWVSL